jgi:hypothetical protein
MRPEEGSASSEFFMSGLRARQEASKCPSLQSSVPQGGVLKRITSRKRSFWSTFWLGWQDIAIFLYAARITASSSSGPTPSKRAASNRENIEEDLIFFFASEAAFHEHAWHHRIVNCCRCVSSFWVDK